MLGGVSTAVCALAQVSRISSRRNLGLSAVVLQKATAMTPGAGQDPIQKLYVDKIREFAKKSKETGDSMYGADAREKKLYQDELGSIKKKYGADREDFTKFPQLGPYTDPEWKADNP